MNEMQELFEDETVELYKPTTPWQEFLDERFCKANPYTWNRPCDNGVLCDRCQTEAAELEFKRWCKRRKKNE